MASLPSTSDVVTALRAAGCVFAEDEARLLIAAAGSAADLDALVRRRCTGVPLEHLLGWVEFGGLRVIVGPGVFVPRRRTELLARQAMTRLGPHSVVVELCCGVAAISGVLLAQHPDLELHAADIDPAAVACARRNVESRAGAVHCGDLYEPLPHHLAGRVDVLVANAPYVPTDEIALMPPEARLHEPRVALDGGPDGLDVARRIVAGAPHWLAPAGHLLIETSVDQAPTLADYADRAGLHPHIVTDDEIGGTVVVATR
jgi:release factor glutamine methyltransferase